MRNQKNNLFRLCALAGLIVFGATVNAAPLATLVTDFSGNRVLKFDADTGDYLGIFASGFVSGPVGVTYGPDGLIYVASWVNGSAGYITRFKPDGTYMGQFGSGFVSGPEGCKFGPDGKLYVCNSAFNTITRFDTDGTYRGSFGGGFLGNYTVDLAFGPDGLVYVSQNGSNAITKFVPETGEYRGRIATGFISSPWGIEFTQDGLLNVVSGAGGSFPSTYLMKFDTDGTYKGIIGNGFINGALSVTCSYKGEANVTAQAFGWVTRLKADGTYNGYYGYGFLTGVFSYGIASPAGVDGIVELQEWIPDEAGQDVTLTFKPVGSTGAPVQTTTVTLGAGGSFVTPIGLTGSFDVYAKGKHWLSRKIGNVYIAQSGPPLLKWTASNGKDLINGDVDGDDQVTIVDYSIFSNGYDIDSSNPLWNVELPDSPGFYPRDGDLDGDNSTNILDYSILSDSYDKQGDL